MKRVIGFLVLTLFALFPVQGLAQKELTVTVEYSFIVPETMSPVQAKVEALDRAKIKAIEENFGSLVTRSNSTLITTRNGQSDMEFLSTGSSLVKGEWIETYGEPVYKWDEQEAFLILTVAIKGKIKEGRSSVNFTAKVLCNGTTLQHERNQFRSGDDLFLTFQTPVDGYLLVYLLDYTTDAAFCLLPYRNDRAVNVKVERDKLYLFFKKNSVGYNDFVPIDEYIITCGSGEERNDIYVIFSKNPLTKTYGEVEDNHRPRQLGRKAFDKWLTSLLGRDESVEIERIPIIIREK